MAIDSDLTGVWIFLPEGNGESVTYVGHEDEYGEPPYRFKAIRQNGSKLHLALIDSEGRYLRYEDGGERIERRAYTSDVRRGTYWRRENA